MHQSIDIANSTILNKPIKINEFNEISNTKEGKGVLIFQETILIIILHCFMML